MGRNQHSSGLTPGDLVVLLDECENRIQSLDDATLQKVATSPLTGYDTKDFAYELVVKRRTVQRKLELIVTSGALTINRIDRTDASLQLVQFVYG